MSTFKIPQSHCLDTSLLCVCVCPVVVNPVAFTLCYARELMEQKKGSSIVFCDQC